MIKKLAIFLSVLTLASCSSYAVFAQSVKEGTVISVEPIYEINWSSIPQNVCHTVQIPIRQGNSGINLQGAIIGGLIGQGLSSDSQRVRNRNAGAIIGGFLNNQHGQVVGYKNQRQCHTEYKQVSHRMWVAEEIVVNVEGNIFRERVMQKYRVGQKIPIYYSFTTN